VTATHAVKLNTIIDVMAAEHVGAYRLRIAFSDGESREVDFEPFFRSSTNPLIRKYLDPELFKQFAVESGDLSWNDYDLCFPVADLYENRNG
jgi:hypothetical protein